MTRAFMAPMVELNATPIHVEILCLVGFFFWYCSFVGHYCLGVWCVKWFQLQPDIV